MFLPRLIRHRNVPSSLYASSFVSPVVAVLRVVARPHLLLDDDLVLAVAVEVADGGVVGRVAGQRLERDRQVRPGRSVGGQPERGARVLLFPVDDRAHGIGDWPWSDRRRCRESACLR